MDKWYKIINDLKLYSVSEKDVHPHCSQEKPELFHTYGLHNSMGSEFEVYNFLFSLVLLLKPTSILETGTQFGVSTLAMACAIEFNNQQNSKITTIDIESQGIAKEYADRYGLTKYINFVNSDSIPFLEQYQGDPFDFIFFDSAIPVRNKEFKILLNKNKIGKYYCFHDTSRLRHDVNPSIIEEIDRLSLIHSKNGVENHLSRGFRLFERSEV